MSAQRAESHTASLPWLLDEDNPSVRWQALVDLAGCAPGDPDARAARAATGRLPIVQEAFAGQHPDGHWGGDPAKPFTARGTLGVLGLLHTLAVEPDGRTAAGCDSLLRHCQHESGGFSMTRTRRSGVFPCTTSERLPMLAYFGFADDPRVRRAFEFVVEQACSDNGLGCGRYAHRACLWGAIAALNGLAVLPADLRSPRSDLAVQRMAEALLGAAYDFEGEHRRWLTLGVPRAWDLLSALRALAAHGFARDPRFAPLFDLFLAQQDGQGRWACGSVSRTWPLEKRSRPSKWVTLDALRLLRAVKAGV